MSPMIATAIPASAARAGSAGRQAAQPYAGLTMMPLRPAADAGPLEADATLLAMRRAVGPVLAVTRTLVGLPRLVIVAVDFSRASLHAARVAMSTVASDATVLLVNVQPDLGLISNASEGYCAVYAQGVKPALARLRRELEAPAGVAIESVILRGDPLGEILALAERTGVDLIAAGTRRQPASQHMALGGFTTGLVRDGRFSLLVAPPLPGC